MLQFSFKIVDEDIDIAQIRSGNDRTDEEAPTVAEVIDERPDDIKQMEEYTTRKWKKIVGGT